MNKILDCKKELSSAQAVANRSSDLKRKMMLSSALPAANSMAEERDNYFLSTRHSAMHDFGDEDARNESRVENVSSNSDEHTNSDAREFAEETIDTSDALGGKCGLTIGLNTKKYTRKYGVKPTIIIPEGINRPVGLHASKHASLIGALIKREAPMQVEGWSKIPNETKEELFKKLTVSVLFVL
ncbi:hypothetical protein ACJIZ3_021565 [Penstemon smallii]|uniref:Uncharacterized protein n=1 Tax=Penstemon smallii TaxID=265156 RepID=A0ABD3SME3_9LAMI